MLFFSIKFFVYCMLNEVPLEAWLTLDSCYLIGWKQKKNPRGDHGLNEHVHSDCDPRGDHGEWGRCIMQAAVQTDR